MKIIGQTQHGWIVDIDKEELANFAGHFSSYSAEVKDFKVGVQLSIGSIYKDASETVGHFGHVKNAVETLNKQSLALMQKLKLSEGK